MSRDFAAALLGYSKESGIGGEGLPSPLTVPELLADEQTATDETLDSYLSTIEDADQVETDLQGIVDETIPLSTGKGGFIEKSVDEVSVESLIGRYQTVLKAYRVPHLAYNVEAATSASKASVLRNNAVTGLQMVSGMRKQMEDYSKEGAIMEFFRRDKSRLAKAHDTLVSVNGNLSNHTPTDGVYELSAKSSFVTKGGEYVTALKEAVTQDTKWIKDLVSVVEGGLTELSGTDEGGDFDHIGTELKSKLEHLVNKPLLGSRVLKEDASLGSTDKPKVSPEGGIKLSESDVRTIVTSVLDLSTHVVHDLENKIGAYSDKLDKEDKKNAKHVLHFLLRLANVVYEHAIYLTVNTAASLHHLK